MTKALWELSLDELKVLHKEGKLTRKNLLKIYDDGYTVNHLIARYNPEALEIFQWGSKKGLLIRKDLLIKGIDGNTVHHLMACYSYNLKAFEYFEWGIGERIITKNDLMIKNGWRWTLLDCFSNEDGSKQKVLDLFDNKESNND